jgi:glutamyl-tRNA reductase
MSHRVSSYNSSLSDFCIIGINYRKSDMNIRGKFSLSTDQSVGLLKESSVKKIPGCLVLSTCNRTEIYGLSEDHDELIDLFCSHTNCSRKDFLDHGYVFNGLEAIGHLFRVASGLDSQIVGDYEILSQLKQAARLAKENGCINSFMERAINYALQVSKEIKTKTKLSSGTVSVSYAAIEIIKEKTANLSGKKILLVGTGKFGNHIAKNLKDYLPGTNISFTNRTNEKASELAELHHAEFIDYQYLSAACNDADIIIASSAAGSYTIHHSFFVTPKSRLILDLAVPQNVEPEVKDIPGTMLLNVDEVSAILDKTISLRQAEIPKALEIIQDTLNSLEQWHRQQFNNPLLVQVKSQLFQLNEIYFNELNGDKIHKSIAALAIQLKHKNNKGCLCINALNSYLQMNYETTS